MGNKVENSIRYWGKYNEFPVVEFEERSPVTGVDTNDARGNEALLNPSSCKSLAFGRKT